MSRSTWIEGIATLTIATSRIVMKNAAPTTARMSHLWRSGAAGCAASVISVAEVAAVREDHNCAGGTHGADHLVVAARAARLDDRRDAGVERELRAVREGEERVGREDGAGELVAAVARLVERQLDRVDPALLTRADADGHAVAADDDGVRGHVLAHAPGEEEIGQGLVRRLAADDVELIQRDVALLDEEAAGDALGIERVGEVRAAAQDPGIGLGAQGVESRVVVPGSD